MDTDATHLKRDAYDYDLPPELIARYPLAHRDGARMLGLNRKNGRCTHGRITDLPTRLNPGDVLVLNNTRVLPARFLGHREGHTGQVEMLLLHPAENTDPALPEWHALMRPARKLTPGTRIILPITGTVLEVTARGERGRGTVRVHLLNTLSTVEALMEAEGQMPIPPYLGRSAEDVDRERYQTVFAQVPGALAAPTAGLHFTPTLLAAIQARGVHIAYVTLAVSSGTFRDVETEHILDHTMDPEQYTLSPEATQTILKAKADGHRVVAVGTTVVKTLETIAQLHKGRLVPHSDWSRLFIYPGFPFRVVDALLTNFHLPRSTLLMLISAFSERQTVLNAYYEAVTHRYRFYSYGDCMLIT